MFLYQFLSTQALINKSVSYDGYVREAAVKALSARTEPEVIPALINRLNDWVHEVQQAAIVGLHTALQHQTLTSLQPVLPAIYHLKQCSRYSHQTLIASLEALLINGKHRMLIIEGLKHNDIQFARQCLHLVLTHQLISFEELLPYAVSHHDAVVRLRILNYLLTNAPDTIKPCTDQLLNDPATPNRRQFIRFLLEGTDGINIAKSALMDSACSIRELAIWFMREQSIDPIPYYQQALSEQIHLPSALWGLAHLNSQTDLPAVRKYLSHPSPKIQQYALWSLIKLDPENQLDYLTTSMKTTRPKIWRFVISLIIKEKIYVPATVASAWFTSLLQQCHCKISDKLIHHLNHWEALCSLLLSWQQDEEASAISPDAFEHALSTWLNKPGTVFTTPNPTQREIITSALNHARALQHSKDFNRLKQALERCL